jgi:hypothetical protein
MNKTQEIDSNTPVDCNGKTVTMCGYVERRTTILRKWKKVFLVLMRDELLIFLSEKRWKKGKGPLIRMSLLGAGVECIDDFQMFTFMTRTCFKETIRSDVKSERDVWVQTIKKTIDSLNKIRKTSVNKISPRSCA